MYLKRNSLKHCFAIYYRLLVTIKYVIALRLKITMIFNDFETIPLQFYFLLYKNTAVADSYFKIVNIADIYETGDIFIEVAI